MSDSPSSQMSMFPDLAPEVPIVEPTEEPPVDLVVRTPGWRLVTNRSGPRGFHLIKTVGLEGSVVTPCGLTGRVITENERMIVPCPTCQALSPAFG